MKLEYLIKNILSILDMGLFNWLKVQLSYNSLDVWWPKFKNVTLTALKSDKSHKIFDFIKMKNEKLSIIFCLNTSISETIRWWMPIIIRLVYSWPQSNFQFIYKTLISVVPSSHRILKGVCCKCYNYSPPDELIIISIAPKIYWYERW